MKREGGIRMIDSNIIDQIIKGDQSAFKELYNTYKNRVYKTAWVMLSDTSAAEDILQEVFITVYSKIYKLKCAGAFESWLYKITVNCCNQYLRKHKLDTVSGEDIFEEITEDSHNDPESKMIEKENGGEIIRYIYKLPLKQRNCIILFYYNHLSIKEIADILECTEGTIKSNLFKGKKSLEKRILKDSSGGEIAWI